MTRLAPGVVRRGRVVGAVLLSAVATACIVVPIGSHQEMSTPVATIVSAAQRAHATREIEAMMRASASAWSRGDLDAFMDYYEPETTTTFVTSTGVVRGRAAIRARYAPRFAPGARHDSLSFEDVTIDVLAPDVANVVAWYRLTRADSTVARGPTSVVVRHDADGVWRIVHDHSS